MTETRCQKCGQLPEDVVDVVIELLQLRDARYRGSIELHLDGSGRIKSRKKTDFRRVGKFSLTR